MLVFGAGDIAHKKSPALMDLTFYFVEHNNKIISK